PAIANETLDRVFDGVSSKKLRSHVWSIIPGGTLSHLKEYQYGTIDIYDRDTSYPAIRKTIETFLANNPTEPFVEFAYYTIGEFDKALSANPRSVIGDVLHYAKGHTILESLLKEMMELKIVKIKKTDGTPDDYDYYTDGVNSML